MICGIPQMIYGIPQMTWISINAYYRALQLAICNSLLQQQKSPNPVNKGLKFNFFMEFYDIGGMNY